VEPILLLSVAVLVVAPPAETRFDAAIAAAIADVGDICRPQHHPIPLTLVRAVIRQESAFNPHAVSKVGAVGLMQVMPVNARKLGFSPEQLLDPRLNILAGVRLLAALLRHYEGDVIAALTAYNSGPKPKLAPIPVNGETPGYVLAILRYWRAYDREAQRLP